MVQAGVFAIWWSSWFYTWVDRSIEVTLVVNESTVNMTCATIVIMCVRYGVKLRGQCINITMSIVTYHE